MSRATTGRRLEESQPVDQLVCLDRLASGGRAVGRLEDGRVVFVPGALPGDRVRVGRARVRKSFCEATEVELVEASPHRVEAPCPDAGRCGGCALMALAAPEQQQAKLTILQDALERVGRLETNQLDAPVGWFAGDALGYRCRVRLQLRGGSLGFFATGSHELVEIERCHVCSPELWTDVERLRDQLGRFLSDRSEAETVLQGIDWIEVRRLPGADRGSVHLGVGRRSRRTPMTASLLKFLAREFRVDGDSERLKASDATYLLSPVGSFIQVNQQVNAELVRHVLALGRDVQAAASDQAAGGARFLDVFCGSGNFSLPLSGLGLSGVGIEADGPAIRTAQQAANEQGLDCEFIAAVAQDELSRLVAKKARFELVVVDPPRAGARGLASQLSSLCSGLLVMVSCDPVTLGRDLRELVDRGFELAFVQAFDMFPQTHHVESMAVLRANRG